MKSFIIGRLADVPNVDYLLIVTFGLSIDFIVMMWYNEGSVVDVGSA
ncbi:MAG: hypothetical protein K2O29_08690 [Ruminococcus sp.]|nr:hypothetical protein [Ruminococcus sp.]MDE7138514.1 hypothetical protein [Ruminococcus sp.]